MDSYYSSLICHFLLSSMACGCVGSPNSSGITRSNDCGYCNEESEKKQRYISKDSFTIVIDVYIFL